MPRISGVRNGNLTLMFDINVSKCEVMSITLKCKPRCICIIFNGVGLIIERAKKINVLWIIVQNCVSWDSHIYKYIVA